MHPDANVLKEILRLLAENKTYAKQADVARLFATLAEATKGHGAQLDKKLSASLHGLRDALARSESRIADTLKAATSASSKDSAALRQEANKLKEEIAWLKSALESLPDILSEAHIEGMLEAFRGTIEYPVNQDTTPELIRDLLEKLEDEERLDASAIKNLPEATQKIVERYHGNSALYTLADVDLAGIQPGQSITWDGIKWLPYTPAGGGGTPVWGEDLTLQGPGTAFTLAHTPITGSVRLFRGGAYQSASQGDYSITGADITLSPALADGEVLVADYSFN